MKLSSQKFFGTREPHSFPYMSVELPSPSGRGASDDLLKSAENEGRNGDQLGKYLERRRAPMVQWTLTPYQQAERYSTHMTLCHLVNPSKKSSELLDVKGRKKLYQILPELCSPSYTSSLSSSPSPTNEAYRFPSPQNPSH